MNSSELPRHSFNLAILLEHRKRILKIAVAVVQRKSPDLLKAVEKTSTDINVPIENVYEALSVYVNIIRRYMESATDKVFFDKLSKLQLSSDFVENLPFVGNSDEFRNILHPEYSGCVNLSLLKWRVDISLLNSLLTRRILSNVIISLSMNNGSRYNIELDMKAFHELRLSVVLILKKLSAIKSSSLFCKT